MRLGEKKILKFYMNFSKICLSLVEIKDEAVKYFFYIQKIIQKIKENYGDNCPFDFYVYDVLIKLIEAENEDVNTNISI